ncbi:MAG: thioredoxin domain-containing protein [Bacteroidetes bacterium]|nr:thioredoxin domain-containing protein [Bacteroidota bacterium]
MSSQKKHRNALASEKSPYLLQHAHNPVQWQAWSEAAFAQAKKENKLVLISVGYSACHWCHVMERECFEAEDVAALMNKYFINIKVDREERPDVDHLYMTAVQLMTQQGGWPLNCFTLPDGRPIYGGTYFPKQQWLQLLQTLAEVHQNDFAKVESYANKLAQGIKQAESFIPAEKKDETPNKEILQQYAENFSKRFDTKNGGSMGAPKFMMPNNYLFLLRYGHLTQHPHLLKQVHLTLQKMAQGGLYDQLGGGFARYSTDEKWKVPHFEKMLYDNAQLISLYSEAYMQSKNPLYKEAVYRTIAFVKRELTAINGGFYSALDADSEGKEGLYYIWTKEELQSILGNDFAVFSDYFSVNEKGYWEQDYYILLREKTENEIAIKHQIPLETLQKTIACSKEKLMAVRNKRVRPGLDDKIVASWNGLMCSALCDAYQTFLEPDFLQLAVQNAQFIQQNMIDAQGFLYRCHKETTYIQAFADDYAFVIEACIKLYGLTAQPHWLAQAEQLTETMRLVFLDKQKNMFYFSGKETVDTLSKKIEIHDNVLPASNSQMARNLFLLAKITGTTSYEDLAVKMTKQILHEIPQYPSGYSNWALALLQHTFPFYEVCIVGKSVDEFMQQLQAHYQPNAIFVFSKTASDTALLKGRYKEGETQVYVCHNRVCKAPLSSIEEAIKQIK